MCLRYARYAYVTYLHTGVIYVRVYGYYVTYVARNTLRTLRKVETGLYAANRDSIRTAPKRGVAMQLTIVKKSAGVR